MKNYSVDDVSNLLDVDQETVRRWIRNGTLPANGTSRKSGKAIPENELIKFLKETPKYMTSAINNLSSLISKNPGVAVASILIGGIGAGIISLLLDTKTESDEKVNKSEIKELMEKNKNNSQQEILKKKQEIEKLQKEILEEENKIKEIDLTIKGMAGE